MRRSPIGICCLLVLVFAVPASAQRTDFLPYEDFVRDWQISSRFTIAVAQKMPSEAYNFKPTPDVMSFGEQLMHIAGSLFDRFGAISGKKPHLPPLPAEVTKDVVLNWLNQSFDYVVDVLPQITNGQLAVAKFKVDFEGRPGAEINGRDMVLNMFVHVAHHRAQCEVYLRLNGIAPPLYTF